MSKFVLTLFAISFLLGACAPEVDFKASDDRADEGSACSSIEPEEMEEAIEEAREAMMDQLLPNLDIFPLDFYLSLSSTDRESDAIAIKEILDGHAPPYDLTVIQVGDSYHVMLGTCPGVPGELTGAALDWLLTYPQAIETIGGTITMEEKLECESGVDCCTISAEVPLVLLSETSDEGDLFPGDFGCNS